MRVLIAPNAFKGCLSALEAARLMAQGVLKQFPSATTDLMPISDGGDGLIEVLLRRHGGRRVWRQVQDALGRPRRAYYALLKDGKTAVIEMAQASGMAAIPRSRLRPLQATSFGTGELIYDALSRGCRRILIGMGGSASSDGGFGMAAALGAQFLDAKGRSLPLGAEPLLRLCHVDARPLRRFIACAELIAISDVTNPLLGPRGSAKVYGPQKGATPAMVAVLEKALGRYSSILKKDLGCDVSRLAGAGAAGGLGAGLAAFLRARIVPGADWVLGELGATKRLASADWVITGEGQLDAQSFYGKAPLTLARYAARSKVPVLLLCGQIDKVVLPRLKRLGVRRTLALKRPMETDRQAISRTCLRLPEAAGKLLRTALAQRAALIG